MPTPTLRIASLDAATLEKVQAMEQELGSCIVALEPYFPPAALTNVQLKRLKSLEEELGVILLAYRKD